MLTLTFAEFAEGSKFPDDFGRNYRLYVVRKGKNILYVGISEDHIWNRWFGGGTSHMWFAQKYSGTLEGGSWQGNSRIGIEIQHNFPKSNKWLFDFWTLKEALDFMKTDYIYNEEYNAFIIGIHRLSIKDVEPEMINFLSPKFNVIYNGARLTKRAVDEGDSPAKIYFSTLKHLSSEKADHSPALHH